MKKLYWLALFVLLYCLGLLLVSYQVPGFDGVGDLLMPFSALAATVTVAWMVIAAIEKKSAKK